MRDKKGAALSYTYNFGSGKSQVRKTGLEAESWEWIALKQSSIDYLMELFDEEEKIILF